MASQFSQIRLGLSLRSDRVRFAAGSKLLTFQTGELHPLFPLCRSKQRRVMSKTWPSSSASWRSMPAAASELRSRYHGKLVGVLRSRGANQTEAEDLVADLWTDCFAAPRKSADAPDQIPGALRARIVASDRGDASPGRLETAAKFSRRGPRLRPDSPEDFFDRRPQPEKATSEKHLLKLLRAGDPARLRQAGCGSCPDAEARPPSSTDPARNRPDVGLA